MCNILILDPGQMIDKEKFINMCKNNTDGYGIIIKKNNKLVVLKESYKVNDTKEMDPEALYKLVLDNVRFKRYVHVRYTTHGDNSLDNAHPFLVYGKPNSKDAVYFMHNGTFFFLDSKSLKELPGIDEKDVVNASASDTLNMCTFFLTPFLNNFKFEGKGGHYSNQLAIRFINSFWGSSKSRGLFISLNQPDLLIGEWEKMKCVDNTECYSSNLSYFNSPTARIKAITYANTYYVNSKPYKYKRSGYVYTESSEDYSLSTDNRIEEDNYTYEWKEDETKESKFICVTNNPSIRNEPWVSYTGNIKQIEYLNKDYSKIESLQDACDIYLKGVTNGFFTLDTFLKKVSNKQYKKFRKFVNNKCPIFNSQLQEMHEYFKQDKRKNLN